MSTQKFWKRLGIGRQNSKSGKSGSQDPLPDRSMMKSKSLMMLGEKRMSVSSPTTSCDDLALGPDKNMTMTVAVDVTSPLSRAAEPEVTPEPERRRRSRSQSISSRPSIGTRPSQERVLNHTASADRLRRMSQRSMGKEAGSSIPKRASSQKSTSSLRATTDNAAAATTQPPPPPTPLLPSSVHDCVAVDQECKELQEKVGTLQKINQALGKDLECLMEVMDERDTIKADNDSLRQDLDALLENGKRQANRDRAIIDGLRADLEMAQRLAQQDRSALEAQLDQRNDYIQRLEAKLSSSQASLVDIPSRSIKDSFREATGSVTPSSDGSDVPSLDAELVALTREKEKLQSDYSKIPLTGGNPISRQRGQELQDMLDKVDSQLYKVKKKIQHCTPR